MHKRFIAAVLLALGATAAPAQQATPVGLWKTIDEKTGQDKSLVRISDIGGVLTGSVEKIFDPGKQDIVCEKCSDARKGRRVLGMTIVEGVKRNPAEPFWDGGTILDPNDGKSYRVRLTPIDGAKTLEVRGFVGPFYRNQTWVRVE